MSQTHVVNGATFHSYNCKLAETCRHFNPALTEKVTVGVRNHPETNRIIERLNRCTHGGGCGCASYRNHLKRLAGGYRTRER